MIQLKNVILNQTEDILIDENQQVWSKFLSLPELSNSEVRSRVASFDPNTARRASAFPIRKRIQETSLNLPSIPTTTIGSLPQTHEVRSKRLQNKKGLLSNKEYENFIDEQIKYAVKFQEELDIDVLVHGEFERNDMVEFFGERLGGFAFSSNAWVQVKKVHFCLKKKSFGSRYVKPPILFGDVFRPSPITLRETCFAQSLTSRPVKGMLTGPITILQWSFVREDQPRKVRSIFALNNCLRIPLFRLLLQLEMKYWI